MRGALTNEAQPGLYSKPMDAAIGQLLALHHRNTQNTNKKQLLASNYGTFRALVISENFIPQNGPSTRVIDATSFV